MTSLANAVKFLLYLSILSIIEILFHIKIISFFSGKKNVINQQSHNKINNYRSYITFRFDQK